MTIRSKILKLSRTISTGLTMSIIILALSGFSTKLIGYAWSSEIEQAPEYLLKAGYIYRFIYFVEWPDKTEPSENQTKMKDGEITIGILGKDPFGNYILRMEGRIIKSMNKRVAIKHLGRYKAGMDLKQCHVLYISPSEKDNLKKILGQTRGTAILTVADTKGFLESGGMVNLVYINELIRWEINLNSINQSGLSVSATLLQSAVRVIYTPESKDKK